MNSSYGPIYNGPIKFVLNKLLSALCTQESDVSTPECKHLICFLEYLTPEDSKPALRNYQQLGTLLSLAELTNQTIEILNNSNKSPLSESAPKTLTSSSSHLKPNISLPGFLRPDHSTATVEMEPSTALAYIMGFLFELAPEGDSLPVFRTDATVEKAKIIVEHSKVNENYIKTLVTEIEDVHAENVEVENGSYSAILTLPRVKPSEVP